MLSLNDFVFVFFRTHMVLERALPVVRPVYMIADSHNKATRLMGVFYTLMGVFVFHIRLIVTYRFTFRRAVD